MAGVHNLDEISFWAVFLLACAFVSKPIELPCAALGIGLLALGWYKTGLAKDPEAPDDVQFTRFFLGATLVVYAVITYTRWEIGMWLLMLCGMFLMHCARNLMVVEKVIVPATAGALPTLEPQPQETFEDLDEALQGAIDARQASGVEAAGLEQARARLAELARQHFLLRQRGALYLAEAPVRDVPGLERELAKAEAERDGETEPTAKEMRAFRAASLRRILETTRHSHEQVSRFRNAVDAIDEMLADLRAWRSREGWDEDVPGWLTAALPLLEQLLKRAEEDLQSIGGKQES